MQDIYITVTGFARYYGRKPFKIGGLFICEKEPSNKLDSEAIMVKLPYIGVVGYVANSVNNVAAGTMSAGRVYDKVDDVFYVRVMFITQSKVICRIEEEIPEKTEAEIKRQMAENEQTFSDL